MKFSQAGLILNSDRIAGGDWSGTALGWDFETPTTAIGYGGWDNHPRPGLYRRRVGEALNDYLGDYAVASQIGLYANQQGRWLSNHAGFTLDDAGTRFSNRTAIGYVGDEQFFILDDYATICVRHANGHEDAYPAPGWKNDRGFAGVVDGVVYWHSADGRLHAIGGPEPALPPGTYVVKRGLDGRAWAVGYVSQWGLSLLPLDGNGAGYSLSLDAYDFYPDLLPLTPDTWRIGSSETQADTSLRLYDIDLANRQYRRTRGSDAPGPWTPLVLTDLTQPPAGVEPDPLPVRANPFPVQTPCGCFFVTDDPLGLAGEAIGTTEVIVHGTKFAHVRTKQPVIAGESCVDGVPDGFLRAIFVSVTGDGALVNDAGAPLSIDTIRDKADARGVPIAFYFDGTGFVPAVLDRWVRANDWMVLQAYPTHGETADQAFARIQINYANAANRWSRIGFAVAAYTQTGNWTLRVVKGLLNHLLTWLPTLRSPIAVIEVFAKGRKSGMDDNPSLVPFVKALATAAAGGTIPAPGPTPGPSPAPVPKEDDMTVKPIRLKSDNGLLVAMELGGATPPAVASLNARTVPDHAGGWELFDAYLLDGHWVDGARILLRSNGRWISGAAVGGTLGGTVATVFTLRNGVFPGTWAFQGEGGYFLSARHDEDRSPLKWVPQALGWEAFAVQFV